MHVEIEVVIDSIDSSQGLEPLDHVDHERDRLHRADVRVGWKHPQSGHVGSEEFGLALSQGHPVLTGGGGAFEKRVVDVGDVLHVADGVTGAAPGPVEQVEGQVGVGVAQVGRVVGGDPADIEPCRVRRWHDGAYLFTGGVEDLDLRGFPRQVGYDGRRPSTHVPKGSA